ncbi:MAG: NEW3 domain-containing protein [Chloroflexota bacterium]
MHWFLTAALVALTAVSPVAQAQFQGLTLSTPFPSQVIPPGAPVTLPIEVASYGLPPQVVELEVVQAPDGWQVSFLGEGRVVYAVYLGPDDSQSLTLKVEPLADAGLGDYSILLRATASGAAAELPIQLTLGEAFAPQLKLTAELPVLRGSATSSFTYRARLENDSDQDLLVSLTAEAPEGFEVVFKQSTSAQEFSSLAIEAGRTQNVNIEVHPPSEVIAGQYPIVVTAQGDQAVAQLQLTAEITGQPELNLTTQDGRLSGRVYSGRTTSLRIVVSNTGTAEAQNIRLESTPPSRWNVSFVPEVIDSLLPQTQVEVTVNIRPADQAVAGDYMLTLRAVAENGSRSSADFRITLLTSTAWGVVGLVLIAAALGVVALAVARFGRR